jgi:TolA-binding protein
MKVRTILVLTAIVSAILGSIVAYLVLSVPNDLKAGSLLKEARAQIADGKNAEAHDTLTAIIQQYPRTDAAAAAMVALVKLDEQEREQMRAEINRLRKDHEMQAKEIDALESGVETIRNTPPPAPPVTATTAPPAPAKTTVTKKAPAKKTPTKKTTTKRRKR